MAEVSGIIWMVSPAFAPWFDHCSAIHADDFRSHESSRNIHPRHHRRNAFAKAGQRDLPTKFNERNMEHDVLLKETTLEI